jgi:lysophospholipase L1-like esterase
MVTPATKLVTIAVGGNDIDYNATADECDNPATCAAAPNLATLVANTRTALKNMIAKIQAAAPSATIVFVRYPREVPPGTNCPALGFTNSGAALVRSMGRKLENAFVQVVKPLGVIFVDPYAVPGDHTACAPPSQVRVRCDGLCPSPNGPWAQGDGPDDHQGPRRVMTSPRRISGTLKQLS